MCCSLTCKSQPIFKVIDNCVMGWRDFGSQFYGCHLNWVDSQGEDVIIKACSMWSTGVFIYLNYLLISLVIQLLDWCMYIQKIPVSDLKTSENAYHTCFPFFLSSAPISTLQISLKNRQSQLCCSMCLHELNLKTLCFSQHIFCITWSFQPSGSRGVELKASTVYI